ncbi:MAG: ATP-binding protein [Proteobacteria bacterium]|nr:ATP-binding protein [Pseudomonadota bacterium]
MLERTFWIQRVKLALEKRSLVWLSGVRRVGKTTLCSSLGDALRLDCELPSARLRLEDPEFFWRAAAKTEAKFVVLDEVHRLPNPSEVLKIAVDHFPQVKVVATGSSTLAARKKFQDNLAGRKLEVWLTPAPPSEWNTFVPSSFDFEKRSLFGGLPPFLLAQKLDDELFTEWMDSYWSKDVQELFSIEKRSAFMGLLELIFRQSGELFEATAYSESLGVSRQTVQNYLEVLSQTHVAHIIRPFNAGGVTEIKAQPKVFGFDTGFVNWCRGVSSLSSESQGNMLEHLVLCELNAIMGAGTVYYWRNKQKNEIDFVIRHGRGNNVDTIECKSKLKKFEPNAVQAFRKIHPSGRNIVITLDSAEPQIFTKAGLEFTCLGVEYLGTFLRASG